MISNQAGRKGEDFKMVGRRAEMRPVWLPRIRLEDMATDGMDAAVLFGGGPLGTADAELYTASFDAYNRWVWDFAGADRKRLVPVGYVPMRDVDETVAMIRNLAKLGFRTINVPAFPQAKDGPNVGGFNAQALALDPRCVEALVSRGAVRLMQRDAPGARTDLEAALAIDPQQPHALANLALAKHAAGDREAALADLDRALALAPPDWPPRAHFEAIRTDMRRRRP